MHAALSFSFRFASFYVSLLESALRLAMTPPSTRGIAAVTFEGRSVLLLLLVIPASATFASVLLALALASFVLTLAFAFTTLGSVDRIDVHGVSGTPVSLGPDEVNHLHSERLVHSVLTTV